MSNEEYIASGILELYAAGGLTQVEREEVEARASESAEIRAALNEACAAMEEYARLHAVTPRPALKNRILEGIAEDELETAALATPMYTSTSEESTAYRWMLAASIALFLLSGLLSYHFYSKWQQAEEQLAIAVASEQLMAKNFETTSGKTQQLEQALAVLRDPAYKPIRLEGVEGHADAGMMVYWNADEELVYVDNITLPPPPAGAQYQLWALDNGKPIDAGLIELSESAIMQQMKSIGSAQAFAVTLEPEGGSKIPTLEKLMVMGEIKA